MSAIARATLPTDSTSARDQRRVLLVADDPALAAYGARLEKAGFKVVGVAGGAAAVVSIKRSRPHVVIADINLKGLSSLELARLMRQSPESVPLIFLGEKSATNEQRGAAMTAGAFDYFQIPTDLSLLVARTAQLVVYQQRVDALRAEADRDYLTGLANRRRFRLALGQEVERWRRYKLPCALVLLDIDFMKRINDTHGHSAGDTVIRHIASSLVELSRDNDTAARLGGEEFALLLAGADKASATAFAERLREVVSNKPLETVGTVTISLGVAACPAHAITERAIYDASDTALYRAKREGRNRVAIASEVQTHINNSATLQL